MLRGGLASQLETSSIRCVVRWVRELLEDARRDPSQVPGSQTLAPVHVETFSTTIFSQTTGDLEQEVRKVRSLAPAIFNHNGREGPDSAAEPMEDTLCHTCNPYEH